MTAVENKEYTPYHKAIGIPVNQINRKDMKLGFFERHLPVVERSDGTAERFVPSRIVNSLISETSICAEDAAKVTEKTVIRLLNTPQKTVTAPFIREQVCDILYRMNPMWRFEYTRLGMPFKDFDILCGSFLKEFKDINDIDERVVENIMSDIDNAKLVQILKRMFRDYVGVRNNIESTK